jgi:leader peptidase (prepilin peptidase)/N-methyltransferase
MTPSQHLLLAGWFLVLGSCVGSFLNVIVYRIPLGLSLLRPRSLCPRCRASILPRDNIPVLGWLLRGGKCRDCRGGIPIRYPCVELAVGLLYAGAYLAGVALAGSDPWEDLGALGVLACLLAAWSLIAGGVVAVLMTHDARRIPERAEAGPAVGTRPCSGKERGSLRNPAFPAAEPAEAPALRVGDTRGV